MSANMFTAEWLMKQPFPPIQYIVPGIIPEGMTLLVAAPKIGKSWLVLGLGIELSNGGQAFGCIPLGKPRPVLYLALEDTPRRLQDRIETLGAAERVNDRLQFIVALEREDKVIQTIRDYIAKHDGLDPVVILDTLGKVMPPAQGNQSAYGHDYAMLSALKATCDAVPGSSLLIVHHTRKQDGGDFLDAVSGTQGIAGAADTVMLLKRERHDNRATLQVTSRDAAEGEYSLTLSEAGAWELEGKSLADASQAAQTVRVTAGLGEKSIEIITKINEFPEGIAPKDLKLLLPQIAPGTIDAYLKRAFDGGRIERTARGLYAPIRTARSASAEHPLSYGSFTSYSPDGAVSGVVA
jgi:hypothetical protein